MPQLPFLLLLLFSFLLPVLTVLPAAIHPFFTTSPPTTIPAFSEQSDLAGCPLDLPDELFRAINSACNRNEPLSQTHCCPVLATWLYWAYSGTALGKAGNLPVPPYDMPALPDDSERCVGNVEKAMRERGVHMTRPNSTCDLISCFCGIRLHVPVCTEGFRVSEEGRLVGDVKVRKLERECTSSSVGGCNRCLEALQQLKGDKELDRASKAHDNDCELMGLTWLLSKNRTAYIPTVSAVLRLLMMNGGDLSKGSQSCVSDRDRLPLAVDSAELHNLSSSITNGFPFFNLLVLLSFCWICFTFFSCS